MELYDIEEIARELFDVPCYHDKGVLKLILQSEERTLTAKEQEDLDIVVTNRGMTNHFNKAIDQVAEVLDAGAQKYGFDSILSARSYAGFDNNYQQIGKDLGNWAVSIWVPLEKAIEDIKSGKVDIKDVDLTSFITEFKDFLNE